MTVKIKWGEPKLIRRKKNLFECELTVETEKFFSISLFHASYASQNKTPVEEEKQFYQRLLESKEYNYDRQVLSDGCVMEGFTEEEFASISDVLDESTDDIREFVKSINRLLRHKRKKGKKYILL